MVKLLPVLFISAAARDRLLTGDPDGYRGVQGDCQGSDLFVVQTASADACAAKCEATAGCAGFSHSAESGCIPKGAACDRPAPWADWQFFRRISGPVSPKLNPSQSSCSQSQFSVLPFCDSTLSLDTRVADLVGRMTIEEKISVMGNTDGAVPVPRLGIAALPWGEALHGVVSECYIDGSSAPICPTSFPHALASAATFNRTLWRLVGDAISTEARALNNLAVKDYIGTGPFAPLMLWAPNLNPYRDPRWGRGHETPGEDPFLAGEYGVEFIQGLQYGRESAGKYLKAVAIVKHSFAYDLEGNHATERGSFDAVASENDQLNYYFPPFKAVISRAAAGGLMCSYNAVNGTPSCMNGRLNNDMARGEWGLDGIIVSDCGAIGDAASTAYIQQNFGGSVTAQVAEGLRGGCDFNCGKFYQAHMHEALSNGQVNPSDVDMAVSRMMKKAFQLGLFDPVSDVPYASYGAKQLDTKDYRDLALEGGTQAIVLLKNEVVKGSPLLPLAKSTKIALIGPQLNATTDLLSNYRGKNNVVQHHTPLLAMTEQGNVVAHAKGSDLWQPDESGFSEAVAAAIQAEVAVVFLGLHPQWFDSTQDEDAQEGEDLDRSDIRIPDVQQKLLEAVVATGTPTVVVLINGGQVACPWVKEHVPAVVEAFYPGQFGGDAIAAVLLGHVSPSGRLPYTMYDTDFVTRRPDIGDMSLSARGGITYQYYDGVPLWPFGWGLSYTRFELAWLSPKELSVSRASLELELQGKQRQQHAFSVSVANVGDTASDVTVLAYLTAASGLGPKKELFAFCRLHALPGQSAPCALAVPASVVAHNAALHPGAYAVSVELGDGTAIKGRFLLQDPLLV